MKRATLLLAVGLVVVWLTRTSSAEPVDLNDPRQLFAVTPEAGTWMICVASYTGPYAPELARQLVLEVRNRHHMAAYIYNRGAEQRRQQDEYWQRMQQMHPDVPIRRRSVRITDQCAVLIGGFKDVDSAGAALKKVKAFPLPTLKLDSGLTAYEYVTQPVMDPVKRTLMLDPSTKRVKTQQTPINPFANSFVTRNPLLPPQQAKPEPDPFWKKLNAYEEYSLLSCKRRWTLVIKEYRGASVLQQQTAPSNGFLKMLGLDGNRPGETLGAAGQQAHELARFLRDPRLGFDAYVLHTRTNSLVTVGAFDGLDDPGMARVVRQLAALKFKAEKGGVEDPIGLFARPLPMEVPRFEK